MDKIIINGLNIYGYHGVNPEEKENGQIFILDLELYCDLSKAAVSDDVNDTVSYSAVNKTLKRIFNLHKFDLLEKCCFFIIENLFEEYKMIKKIDITIKKPFAPMKANFDYVAVNMVRERK